VTGTVLSAPARHQGTGPLLPSRRARRAMLTGGVLLLVTAVSIALRVNSPAFLAADWGFDDAHYAKLASRLLDGQWLGPYDQLTLSKGPGYPLFIAGAYKAHIPLKLAEHMVHLLAAATVGAALAKVSRSRLLGVAAYGAIALDPAYLGRWSSGITRDAFYGSLSLLLVGATLLFLAYVPGLVRRGAWAVPLILAAGVALGLMAGAYYITRDERSWLAPALLAAAVAGVASWAREGKVRVWHGGAVVLAVLVAGSSFVWSIDQVASRNQAAYGTRVISDLAEGEIARAYIEWQRVDAGEPEPLVTVNAEQREAVYEISPAAAQLEGHLKGDGTHWMGPDCAPPVPDRCEYTGGYFAWAIREAARVTGHMTTGGEAQLFFGQMADEIAEGCDTELRCVDAGIASMPPLAHIETSRIWASFQLATSYLFSFDVAEPPGWRPLSFGTGDSWDQMIRPLRAIDGTQVEYNAMERRAASRQELVTGLTDLYRWAARLGAVPALLGLALGLLTRAGRRHWPIAAMGVVMVVAVLSRLVLLAIVDATAFIAARYGTYVLPGVDFLVVSLVVGWWLLATVVNDTIQRRRAGRSGDEVQADDGASGGNTRDDPDLAEHAERRLTPSL
jgi:hypothetical protein